MRLLEPHRQGIAEAVGLLRDGHVVGIPTETVYGLAADALDVRAVASIFSVKARPSFDPLIAHVARGEPEQAVTRVASVQQMDSVARHRFVKLCKRFWPGPLTVVVPRSAEMSDLVTAGRPTIAVRMPAHPVAQDLLEAFGGPLVAPSANRFGGISPTCAAHVVAELAGLVPAVIDGGACTIGVESTIVAIDPGGAVRLLRPGGVAVSAIEAEVGPIVVAAPGSSIEAPGQTSRHYSPGTPSRLVANVITLIPPSQWRHDIPQGTRVAILRVTGPPDEAAEHLREAGIEVVEAISLSAGGDLAEAARNLFGALRQLDGGPAELILFEPCATTEGLGHAIADRLQRASACG